MQHETVSFASSNITFYLCVWYETKTWKQQEGLWMVEEPRGCARGRKRQPFDYLLLCGSSTLSPTETDSDMDANSGGSSISQTGRGNEKYWMRCRGKPVYIPGTLVGLAYDQDFPYPRHFKKKAPTLYFTNFRIQNIRHKDVNRKTKENKKCTRTLKER